MKSVKPAPTSDVGVCGPLSAPRLGVLVVNPLRVSATMRYSSRLAAPYFLTFHSFKNAITLAGL